jgi:amino-acid N-acetyltransferase
VDNPVEDISFGPATPDDLAVIRAFLDRCNLPTQDLGPQHLEHFVLGCAGRTLIGTVGLELFGDVALLRSLAVGAEHRRRGVAHELWTRARAAAQRRHVRTICLLTTTAESLFARWGFHVLPRKDVPEVVRQTTEFASLCPSTATVMAIDLIATTTAQAPQGVDAGHSDEPGPPESSS